MHLRLRANAYPSANPILFRLFLCDWRKVHYDLHSSTPEGRNFLLAYLIDTHPWSLSNSITVPWLSVKQSNIRKILGLIMWLDGPTWATIPKVTPKTLKLFNSKSHSLEFGDSTSELSIALVMIAIRQFFVLIFFCASFCRKLLQFSFFFSSRQKYIETEKIFTIYVTGCCNEIMTHKLF